MTTHEQQTTGRAKCAITARALCPRCRQELPEGETHINVRLTADGSQLQVGCARHNEFLFAVPARGVLEAAGRTCSVYCALCMKERPDAETRERELSARLDVGPTADGHLQVWCTRHEVQVLAVAAPELLEDVGACPCCNGETHPESRRAPRRR